MLKAVRGRGFLPGSAVQAPVAVAVAPAASPAHAAAPAGVAVVGIRPALRDAGMSFDYLAGGVPLRGGEAGTQLMKTDTRVPSLNSTETTRLIPHSAVMKLGR